MTEKNKAERPEVVCEYCGQVCKGTQALGKHKSCMHPEEFAREKGEVSLAKIDNRDMGNLVLSMLGVLGGFLDTTGAKGVQGVLENHDKVVQTSLKVVSATGAERLLKNVGMLKKLDDFCYRKIEGLLEDDELPLSTAMEYREMLEKSVKIDGKFLSDLSGLTDSSSPNMVEEAVFLFQKRGVKASASLKSVGAFAKLSVDDKTALLGVLSKLESKEIEAEVVDIEEE